MNGRPDRRPVDEQRLRALFQEIEAPPTLDRWRTTVEPPADEPWEPEPPPVRPRPRTMAAVAASLVVAVGLAGTALSGRLLPEDPPVTPPMIIQGPDPLTDGPAPADPPSAPGTVPTRLDVPGGSDPDADRPWGIDGLAAPEPVVDRSAADCTSRACR